MKKKINCFIILTILAASCTSEKKGSFCQIGTYDVNRTDNKYYDIEPLRGSSQYYATFSIGTPPQYINMVLDTGSANFVVLGAPSICPSCTNGTYTPGPSAQKQTRQFTMTYATSSVLLQEYKDTYKLSCDTQSYDETFGVVIRETNGQSDNILGLAYLAAAQPSDDPLPTFLDVLLKQNKNLENLFSLLLCGNRTGSQFVIGNIDERVKITDVQFTPIIEEKLYTINAKSMQVVGYVNNQGQWQAQSNAVTSMGNFPNYDPKTQSGIATIVDSGTTRAYFPLAMVENMRAIMEQVSATNNLNIPTEYWTTSDPNSPNYTRSFTPDELSKFPMVQITVAGMNNGSTITLDFPPERYLQEVPGGQRVFSYRVSSGYNFIGQAFMEGYYVLFDRANKKIGFAPSDTLCGS